jgi:DNA-binding PadR family transcriptional regulator
MRKTSRRTQIDTTPTDLQLDVLLALHEGPQGSSALLDAVEDIRRRDVPLATFYRQIQRISDLGWIVADDADSSDGPGRPERSYRLSSAGSRVLRRGIEEQRRRVALADAGGILADSLTETKR